MENDINRKQILDSFLENIACLSDEKYQERVWVRAEGPECDDIDDTICDFFDDGDPIMQKYKDYGISDTQFQSLIKLHKKLKIFKDTYDVYSQFKSTETLLKLPQWKEIRTLAKKVLHSFSSKKQ